MVANAEVGSSAPQCCSLTDNCSVRSSPDNYTSPAISRSSPSAIWLRAELPVHRIRTRCLLLVHPGRALSGYSGAMLASFVLPYHDLVARGLCIPGIGNEFQVTLHVLDGLFVKL